MWYRRLNIENICIYEIVRVLYGKTIDVILPAENQSYVRIKKRTVNAPCSSWTHKNTFGVISRERWEGKTIEETKLRACEGQLRTHWEEGRRRVAPSSSAHLVASEPELSPNS